MYLKCGPQYHSILQSRAEWKCRAIQPHLDGEGESPAVEALCKSILLWSGRYHGVEDHAFLFESGLQL